MTRTVIENRLQFVWDFLMSSAEIIEVIHILSISLNWSEGNNRKDKSLSLYGAEYSVISCKILQKITMVNQV
ncbi:MAG: hypothetical protein WB988_03200 [Candidatus Nitrosopolaris sp.]